MNLTTIVILEFTEKLTVSFQVTRLQYELMLAEHAHSFPIDLA